MPRLPEQENSGQALRAPFAQRKLELGELPEAAPFADQSSGMGDEAAVAALPGSFRAMQVAVTTGGMQALILVLMLARSKVIALLLEPHGVGIVSTVDQLAQFIMQVSALGLSIAPVRFISRTRSEGAEAVNRIYQALFKSLLLSTSLGMAICVLVIALDGRVLGWTLAGYKSVVLVALLSMPCLALTTFFSNVLASTKGFQSTIVYLLASTFGSLVAAYVGIRARGIAGLYYGNLVVGAVAVLAVLGYVHKALQLAPHTAGLRLWQELRRHPDIFEFCAIIYVLSFSQPLSFLITRYAVLSSLGPVETGYFQAAFAVSSVVSMVLSQTVRIHLEPQANRAIPKPEKIKTANDFQRSFAVLILLGALPVVLFPREIILLLFSRAFAPISPYLSLFILSDCVYLCAMVYLAVVMAEDLRWFFVTHLSGHVSLAALSWLLVPRFGLAGAAWAFVLSRAGVLLLALVILEVRHGLRVPAGLKGLLLYGGLAIAGVGAAFRGAGALSPLGTLIRLAVFAALASGALLFLNREERTWLGHLLRKVRMRGV